MKTKLTAQVIYDLRELTGFVSGQDLHEAFRDLVGDPSPSGRVEVPWGPLAKHWLGKKIFDEVKNPRQFAAKVRRYSGRKPTDEEGWNALILCNYLEEYFFR